jgi:outer membrane murein-binding lipoprotein Lpp
MSPTLAAELDALYREQTLRRLEVQAAEIEALRDRTRARRQAIALRRLLRAGERARSAGEVRA